MDLDLVLALTVSSVVQASTSLDVRQRVDALEKCHTSRIGTCRPFGIFHSFSLL